MNTLFPMDAPTPDQVAELLAQDSADFRKMILCTPGTPRLSDGLWRRAFVLAGRDATLDPRRMMAGRIPRTFMGWPITEEGAISVGPHRLFLDDAYTLRPKLGWFDADVMDPAYLFKAVGAGQMRKKRQATGMIIAEQLDTGFDHAIINPLRAGSVVVFCHNDQIPEVGTYLKARFKRFIVGGWQKNNPMPVANKHYLYDTEYYFHAWNPGHHPVGEISEKRRFVAASVAPAKIYNHGTVKPDAVMNKIMANVNGQTVCDPFMGTGSTGVAAIRAGKTFTGIEHNPKHFETAVSRIGAAYLEGVAK